MKKTDLRNVAHNVMSLQVSVAVVVLCLLPTLQRQILCKKRKLVLADDATQNQKEFGLCSLFL